MELRKKQVRYIQEGKRIFDQFYLDEDLNVPDAKEDVKQILKGSASVRVEDLRLADSYLRVTGKLYYQILYVTDTKEPTPAVVEGKIPFEEMVYTEGGEKEQYFIQNMRVEFSSAMVHSRKISIRAMIELEIGREMTMEEEITEDLENADDVYKKFRRMNLLEIKASKKDTYRIKEEVTLPGTKESIGQILLTDIQSRKLEIRLKPDMVQLTGELLVFCLYLSEDGKTDWMEQTVPYEGSISLSGVTEEMYSHVWHTLEDTLLDVRLDEDGEMRVLGIEGTLVLRMNLYSEEETEFLEDLYSLRQNCRLETREAVFEELLIQNHSKCKVTERLTLPELKEDVLQICHSEGSVQTDHVEMTEDGLLAEGILHLSFLYLRADDACPFGSWEGMVPFSWLLECAGGSDDCQYQMAYYVEQLSVNLAGGNAVDVKAVLAFDTFIRKPTAVPVITNVEMLETDPADWEKRPGIVGYIVKRGDELWNLAKKYKTTEDEIRTANTLESDVLKEGDKLLIFKANMDIL